MSIKSQVAFYNKRTITEIITLAKLVRGVNATGSIQDHICVAQLKVDFWCNNNMKTKLGDIRDDHSYSDWIWRQWRWAMEI